MLAAALDSAVREELCGRWQEQLLLAEALRRAAGLSAECRAQAALAGVVSDLQRRGGVDDLTRLLGQPVPALAGEASLVADVLAGGSGAAGEFARRRGFLQRLERRVGGLDNAYTLALREAPGAHPLPAAMAAAIMQHAAERGHGGASRRYGLMVRGGIDDVARCDEEAAARMLRAALPPDARPRDHAQALPPVCP